MKLHSIPRAALALAAVLTMTACDDDDNAKNPPPKADPAPAGTNPDNVPAGGQAAGSSSGGSTTGPTSGGHGIPERQPSPGSGP